MKLVSIAIIAFVANEVTLAHGRLLGTRNGLFGLFGRKKHHNNDNDNGSTTNNQKGIRQGDCVRDGTCGSTAVTSNVPLSDEEKNEVIFMREEEKMARDVYTFLYGCWGNIDPSAIVFDRISQSEQQHMDRMYDMIQLYDLDDPVESDSQGIFNNTELGKMYEELTKDCGNNSLVEAFKIGALIEESDIFDLRSAINGTDQAELVRVYGNLLKASYNHYNAFVRQIEAHQGTYEPTVLLEEDSDAILGNTGK